MCGFPPSFPRKRESIFTDKFPHSPHFLQKKIRGNSKLSRKIRGNSKINFCVKFAKFQKLIAPNRIPAFAGMTAFFLRNSAAFCGKWNVLFSVFLRKFQINFCVKCADSRRHSRERGNPFLPTIPAFTSFFAKKNSRKFQTFA